MVKDQFISSLIDEIIDEFITSRYPDRAVEFVRKGIEVYINAPYYLPGFLRANYENIHDQLVASPSIERIELSEDIRNRGLFSGLVDALGALSSVEAVCVSNVGNSSFAEYLANSNDWREIERDLHLLPGPMASALITSWNSMPSFYRKFPKF